MRTNEEALTVATDRGLDGAKSSETMIPRKEPDPKRPSTSIFGQPFDLAAMVRRAPPPRNDVFPGLAPRTVGILHGRGASGKSFLALHMMLAVAAGEPLLGSKHWPVGGPGRVVYLALEDDAEEIWRRIRAIAQWAEFYGEPLSDGALDRIDIYSATRLDFPDFRFMGRGDYGKLGVWEEGWCSLEQLVIGARLLIIEPLIRIHAMDENSNTDMDLLLGRFERLARTSGAAILVGHHESKSLGGSGHASASRGADAIIANARWAASLRVPTEAEVQHRGLDVARRDRYAILSATKVNYAESSGDLWLVRETGGALALAGESASRDTKNPVRLEEVRRRTSNRPQARGFRDLALAREEGESHGGTPEE